MSICDGCGTRSTSLIRCACKRVRYCDVTCQATGRPRHRVLCHSILDSATPPAAETNAPGTTAANSGLWCGFNLQRLVHVEVDVPYMFGFGDRPYPFIVPSATPRFVPGAASSSSSSSPSTVSVPPNHARKRKHKTGERSVDIDHLVFDGQGWASAAHTDQEVARLINEKTGTLAGEAALREAAAAQPSVAECARDDLVAIGIGLEFRYLPGGLLRCGDEKSILRTPLLRTARLVASDRATNTFTFEVATPAGLATRLREISNVLDSSGDNDGGGDEAKTESVDVASKIATAAAAATVTVAAVTVAAVTVHVDCLAFVQILARLRRERLGERFTCLSLHINPHPAQIDPRIVCMAFADPGLCEHLEAAGADADICQFLLLASSVSPHTVSAATPATGLDGDGVHTLTLADWAKRRKTTVAKRLRVLAPDGWFDIGVTRPTLGYVRAKLARTLVESTGTICCSRQSAQGALLSFASNARFA